jgi:hypothetical protein
MLRVTDPTDFASFSLPVEEHPLLPEFFAHRTLLANEECAEMALFLAPSLLDLNALRTNVPSFLLLFRATIKWNRLEISALQIENGILANVQRNLLV